MNLSDSKGDFVVHSVPITTEMYSANYKVLRAAYEDMTSGNLKSALVLATIILREAGESLNRVSQTIDLIDTIANATTIIRGNTSLLNHSDLDDDIKQEVLNKLIFFIVWEFFVLPSEKKDFMEGMSDMMNLTRTKQTVSELLSSDTTPKDGSLTISEEAKPARQVRSSPI